jgi:hypothetical protein
MKLRATLTTLILLLAMSSLASARMRHCRLHWFADCEASYAVDESGTVLCPVVFGDSTTRRRACNADLDSNKIFAQKPFRPRKTLPQLVNGQWVTAPVSSQECLAAPRADCDLASCYIPTPENGPLLAVCSCSLESADNDFVTHAQSCDSVPVSMPQ